MADIRRTSVLDDFNRPNENPLSGGGNWLPTTTAIWTPLELSGQAVTHQNGSSSSDSYWTPQAFDGNVEVWGFAVGGGVEGIAWGVGLFTDIGGSSLDGYRFRIEIGAAESGFTLYRVDNGTFVGIGGGSNPPANGNAFLLLRRNGDQVEGWCDASGTGNGFVLITSVTDTTYKTNLRLSLGVTDNAGFQLHGWASFGGGPKNRPQIFRWVSN